MLSFMKDESSENSKESKSNLKQDGKSPQQSGGLNIQNTQNLSLNNQDFITVAEAGKGVRKSSIVLGILFLVGVVCLFIMIKKSGPTAASASTVDAEKTRIEQAIANLTGIKTEIFSGIEKVLQKFHTFSNVEQVKLGELSKNPFKIDPYFGESVQGGLTGVQASGEQPANGLELFSIMQSNNKICCMINEKILYEGDEVNGYAIVKITEKEVTLRPKATQSTEEGEMVLKLTE